MADTAGYYHAAYLVAGVLYVLYAVSLASRRRKVRDRLSALDRGHAVFVLHGEKLRGGFALQRTRPGAKPQWLLIKRRDDEARPGSDIVAERPESVISGRTLAQLLG